MNGLISGMAWLGALVILVMLVGSCALVPFRAKYGRRKWPIDQWAVATGAMGLAVSAVLWPFGSWQSAVAMDMAILAAVFLVLGSLSRGTRGRVDKAALQAIQASAMKPRYEDLGVEARRDYLARYKAAVLAIEPVAFQGAGMDLVADLREADLYKHAWWQYRANDDLIVEHGRGKIFKQEWFARTIQIVSGGVHVHLWPLGADAALRAFQHLHGVFYPPDRDSLKREAHVRYLVDHGFVDPHMRAPHLTDAGKALRKLLLETCPEVARALVALRR